MKVSTLLTIVIFILSAATIPAQIVFDHPESVAFDEVHNRYLVSDIGSGSIIAVNLDGSNYYFQTGFEFALGNQIAGNTFYVTVDGNRLKGFDLTTGDEVMDLAVTSPVDGITWDGGNYLYVVVTTGKILEVDIAAQRYTTIINSGLNGGAQDVAYDGPNNRLLVAHWNGDGAACLSAIDLSDLSITQAVASGPTFLDGICINDEGYVFLSSHAGGGMIFRWNGEYDNSPFPVVSFLDEPAGCTYNERDGILAISCYGGDSVAYANFSDFDNDGIPYLWDNCPEASNVDQNDIDLDLVGDVCDDCTDTDGDGFGDPGYTASTCQLDNCPNIENPDQYDYDDDGIGNECDNCPMTANPEQHDIDHNGIGDACEGCCQGRVGDANALGGDEPTIGDISSIIDMLFISTEEVTCLAEADINVSGGPNPDVEDITIGDISSLIDYLFITGSQLGLPDCP